VRCSKIGELVICGSKFDIEIQEELFIDEKLDGAILYDDCKIKLDAGMVGDRKVEILLHEVIHGISSALKLHMKEDDVQRMASGLHSMGVGQFIYEKLDG